MGSFTSDNPISFYVVSESYAKSIGLGTGQFSTCTFSGSKDDVLVTSLNAASLSIDFTINQPGAYWFVFLNLSKSNAVHINLNAGIVST